MYQNAPRVSVWLATTILALAMPGPDAPARQSTPEGLEFANGLFRSRRYDVAADEYEKFLASNPEPSLEAQARYGLANARQFLQEYGKAREQFETYLRLVGPSHANAPTARFRIGELSYVLGDLAPAKDSLEAFVQANPTHKHAELAWTYLGDVRYRLGDLEGAEAAYRKSLDDWPDGRLADRARLYLGRTLSARGRADEAEKVFSDLAGRPTSAGRDEAWYQLGLLRAEGDRQAEAIDALETLERDFPQSRLIGRARLARGEALTAIGRFDDADALLAPLSNDPAPELAARAAYAHGMNDLKRDRPEPALKSFEDAADRFPDGPSAPALLYRSAEALAKLGRLEPARDRYLKMLEAHPDDPWADEAMAQAAALSLQLHQPDRAGELARTLPERFPDSPLKANARVIEGRAALDAGQAPKAAELLRDVLDSPQSDDPSKQAARYYLGLALRDSGQADEAAQVFDELSKGPPAAFATEAKYLVGQGHFDAGRHEEAARSLEQYLAEKPDGAAADHALARLSLSHAELGQDDLADRDLARLEEQFPGSPLASLARVRLGEHALDSKHWDRAAGLFEPVASREGDPLRPRALSGLGWSKLESGDPQAAADTFGTLLTASPDDPLAPEAALARAQALEKAQNTDEALAAYAEVGTKYANSKQAPAADLARARLLTAKGQGADAAELYARFTRANQEAADADEVLNEYAWSLLDAGRSDEADAVFRQILDQHPASPRAPEARVHLAESAFRAAKYDEVRSLIEPLLARPEGEASPEVDPRVLQSALYRLGRAQVEQKDWEAAASTFARLVDDFPDGLFPRESRFWAAEVSYLRGDPQKAEAAFGELSKSPAPGTEAEPWLLTARLRHVQCLVLLKKWDEALAEADSLKADAPGFPQQPELDCARGQALMATLKFDDARDAFQAAIDGRKRSELAAQAQFLRGETYFHQEQHRDALVEFLKVATLYDAPRWQAASLLEAGKVYEKLERWADAAKAYEELKANFADDPSAAEATDRLAVARQRSAGSSSRQ